jgi:hypothetical protein
MHAIFSRLGVVRLPHAGLEGSPPGIGKGIVAVPAAASGKRDWNVKNIYSSRLKAGVETFVLVLELISRHA